MKKTLISGLTILIALFLIVGLFMPVSSENDDASPDQGQDGTRGARWSTYKTYYNKTFTMGVGWETDNVSVVVFVQTNDQTDKSDVSNNYQFSSAEVLQSTINDLDGFSVATGTSRRVLAELFTSENCVFCPGAVGAMDRIARDTNYFPTKMSLIEWHPNSGSYADKYGFAGSDARINWYLGGHSFGYPTAIFDGVIERVGGASSGNDTSVDANYKSYINSRTPTASPVEIITRGYKDSTSGWINVSIELKNPTPIRNLKVNYIVVEDMFPEMKGTAYYRHTARAVITQDDFTPPNHPPLIKTVLQDVNINEDESDSTSIQLAPAFEDEDLDVVTFSSDKDGASKEHIAVVIDEDGNVTFTPDTNWNGAEDITFYCDDGIANPVEQTITVTIQSVNDDPYVSHPMTDFTMFEDIPIEKKFNLTYIFGDIDLDPDLNEVPQAPLEYLYSGNVNIEVLIDNNWIGFDPKPDWNGEETITITAKDSSAATSIDDVKIKVTSENDPPVLKTPLPDTEMNEDESKIDFLDLNQYYFDQDGDALTYDFEESDNFEIKLKYLQESVYVTLIPEADYWGTETITFEATDIPGSEPVTAELKVTVNSVNDPPILNSTSDWDIISKDVSFTGTTIEVNEDDQVDIFVTAYDPADNDVLTYTDDTALFNIDSGTGEILFTPTNSDVGEYDVTITIDDSNTLGQVSGVFKFIVNNVNDAPETPQIQSPDSSTTYIAGENIKFKASCDDPDLHIDPTDELLSYEWTIKDGTEVLSLDNEFTNTMAPGTYNILLTVRDKAGEASTAEITITVDIDRVKDTDSDGTPDYQDDDDDNDGMPDSWEEQYSLNPLDPADAKEDPDNDKFTNLQEYLGDDGQPGGDDSSIPNNGRSTPEVVEKSTDGGTTTTLNMTAIIGIVGIILVIIILVIVFVVVSKKRKKKEAIPEQKPQMAPPPQAPGVQEQGQQTLYPPPTSEYPQTPPPPGAPPQYPPMDYQQQPPIQYGQDQGQGPAPDYMTQPPPTVSYGEAGTEQMPSPAGPPAEAGLPPTTQPGETSMLPQPQGEQPIPEEPTTSEQPTLTENSTNTENPEQLETPSACPKCGQEISPGWVLCPNCKEML